MRRHPGRARPARTPAEYDLQTERALQALDHTPHSPLGRKLVHHAAVTVNQPVAKCGRPEPVDFLPVIDRHASVEPPVCRSNQRREPSQREQQLVRPRSFRSLDGDFALGLRHNRFVHSHHLLSRFLSSLKYPPRHISSRRICERGVQHNTKAQPAFRIPRSGPGQVAQNGTKWLGNPAFSLGRLETKPPRRAPTQTHASAPRVRRSIPLPSTIYKPRRSVA